MKRNLLSAVTLVVVSMLVAGTALLARQTKDVDPGRRGGEPDQPATVEISIVDPAIKALNESRLATARDIFEQETARIEQMLPPFPDDTVVWSRRWMEAQVRLSAKPADKLAAIQAHVERARKLEKTIEQYARSGQCRTADALKAKYFRLEAEQMLAEARATHPDLR